jgi:hypothetical protein
MSSSNQKNIKKSNDMDSNMDSKQVDDQSIDNRDFTTKAKETYHDVMKNVSGLVGADENAQFHEKEADKLKPAAQKVREHGEEADSSWEKAKDQTAKGWEKTKEGVSEGSATAKKQGTTSHPHMDRSKEKASDGWDQTKEGIKEGAHAAKEKGKELYNKAKDGMGLDENAPDKENANRNKNTARSTGAH